MTSLNLQQKQNKTPQEQIATYCFVYIIKLKNAKELYE
ncbi:hypothetical protein PMAG_a0832 [Pseudoalteromonas mariniglutinosa NCIMB 1770]|nr:hypothetical protein [Pseudoalteromonas mariniglutinosa NCIMB 1770]